MNGDGAEQNGGIRRGQRARRACGACVHLQRTSGSPDAQLRLGLGKERRFAQVRVHDLKYTFGRLLRAAGVSFEDRQDLLGHRSGRITTHYSAPELERLIEGSNKVCEMDRGRPGLVVLRRLNVS